MCSVALACRTLMTRIGIFAQYFEIQLKKAYPMKSISFIFSLLILFSFSCNSQESSSKSKEGMPLTINGTVKSSAPDKVYLERNNERNITSKIDSVEIGDDLTFTFNTTIEEAGIYQLNIDNRQIIGLLLDGNENLTITADGDVDENGMGSFNVEGSPNMMRFSQVQNELMQFNQKKASMEQEFAEANKKQQAEIRVRYQAANDEMRAKIKPIIAEMGTSMGGIIAANNFLNPDLDSEFLANLGEEIKAEGKDHYFAKLFLQTLAKNSAGKAGAMAPDFTLTNLKGETVQLSKLRGKTVILDFWATWCGPCIRSFPGMKMAEDKYADRDDVVFLFVNTFERVPQDQWKSHVNDFIQKRKYTFDPVLDMGNNTALSYGVEGIPAKFCIDPDGKIKHTSSGFMGTSEAVYNEMVEWIDGK